jgi:hypothetical protein
MQSTLQESSSPASGYRLRPGLWISIALALVTAAILIAERRSGQEWGGDFSLYISHARNLSEGRPYADTGYIVNPYFRSMGPSTYPPLFPLILAPLYARYGLNYSVLKLPGILCFAAGIPVLFCLFRRDLSASQSLLAVFLWAAWPYVLWLKDAVGPDFLFILLWFLALWLLRAAYDESPVRRPAMRGVWIGILAYAAYATRSVGIVLPFAVLCYDLLRFRAISRVAAYATGVFALLTLGQNLLLHSETSYLRMLTSVPAETGRAYLYSLSTLFTTAIGGWQRVVRYSATIPAVVLACVGFVVSLRRFRSPLELMVVLYGALLVFWSLGTGTVVTSTRYIMPVVPFFFLYLFAGLDLLKGRVGPRAGNGAACALVLLILACYGIEDRNFRPGPIDGGVSTPGFAELCRYITAKTNPGDVFVFQNPRVLSLYTRRPASVYPEHGDPQLVWNYSHDIHARYIVVTDFLDGDNSVLSPFVREYADRLRIVFSDANFRLYAFDE